MRRYLSTLPLSLLGLLTLSAASVAQAADQGAERVLSVLQARFPDAQIGTPQPSSITGYYEVNLGSQVLYVSGNGRYLILGDLIDLKSDANLSEARRADLRRQLLGQVDPGSLIVFGSASPRRVITAFTNIHCQYCRNLHQSLKSVLAQGDVQVRYVLLPDGRKGAASYAEAESVWCAPDRARALEKAFSGQKLPTRNCKAPMTDYLVLARKLNIQGLPSMVLDNGSLLTGFVSDGQIRQWLQISPAP
ncbi:DsbC family protein [Thermithiobacillus plumbiphilus]|uniref:Thiol:disulfide interchange protein n=1 Tax=Thermithiobacillus plumbiphilus TaxID=1729899 RepID=A0ABU9D5M6_9PROT